MHLGTKDQFEMTSAARQRAKQNVSGLAAGTTVMTLDGEKAGSLGHTRPQEDMLVGPDTLVHIRDWRAKALFGADVATVKAKRLIDGEFVCEAESATMTVYELVFDRQHILYADGLEVASTAA